MRAIIRWLTILALAAPVNAAPVTLHRGNVADVQTLDVQKYSLTVEAEIVRDLFMGLLTIDAKGDPIPGLAQSWTVSPDGRVYTFTLRPNLQWSDGQPLTAEDAVFGLRRGLDPKTQSWYGNLIYNIRNAEAVNKGQKKPEELGVRALDARTVEISLNDPSPAILLYLSFTPMTYPAPKHAIAKNPDGWARPENMVSSGPYKLGAWRVSDTIRLDKNPRFFDAANVQIDRVFYYPTVDDSAALNRFRAGELDINLRFPPNQIDWLRRNLPAETHLGPAYSVTYLVPNLRRKPFDDVRVRRALSLGVDRAVLTDRVLRNGERPFCGFVPDVIAGYRSACPADARPFAARQEQARALLAAAGYGPDKPLRFVFMHRAGLGNRLAAVAAADMWRAIGVEAELLQSDVAVHYNRLREGDFELADAGWTGNADPELFTYLLLSSSTEVNWGGYANPTYDALALKAQATYDRAARFAAFAQAEAAALNDQALIPLFLPVNRALAHTYVKGFAINPLHSYPTRWLRIEGRTRTDR
jgi:oligopeptide transport system substrate-binding protein